MYAYVYIYIYIYYRERERYRYASFFQRLPHPRDPVGNGRARQISSFRRRENMVEVNMVLAEVIKLVNYSYLRVC